ncbi:beta-galactosidase, partial [Clavibacter michiganensis subsp. insidiosus]
VRVGRFASSVDGLAVAYARPQETGHRPGLRSLVVGDGSATPLTVTTVPDASGHRAGFQLSRWTPQQMTDVGHPHELPASDGLHLLLDDAQHGLGSRACGPDVLPRHALWPSLRTWEVLLG